MNDSVSLEEIAKNTTEIGWDVLDFLSKVERVSISELFKKLKLTYPKGTNELNRLEGGLLVSYSKTSSDKRTLHIQISNYGLKLLDYR